MKRIARLGVAAILAVLGGCGGGAGETPVAAPLDACAVRSLAASPVQGLKVFSPDGSRYLVNAKDGGGTAQVYVGSASSATLACITCTEVPGGPQVQRFKMQPHWHPSGAWIFLAVERDEFTAPPILGLDRRYVEGQLQNGLWTNMYAVSPDGQRWFRLTDFKSGVPGTADGFTGPAITPDGRHAVFSQIVDGNVLVYYPFGRWQLIEADFADDGSGPRLINPRDITPAGMNWNEPGNFHPDGESLLLSGSTASDAQGMDQYVLNIRTLALQNLTNSPTVWDEHGVFSPDGEHILFMSAYPYRADPGASKVLTIKTEFMLMRRDGSGLLYTAHALLPCELGTMNSSKPWRAKQRKLFEQADHAIFLSHAERSAAITLCPSVAARSTVLPNAISASPARCRQAVCSPLVLFAGRFCSSKGVDVAAAAMKTLLHLRADVRCALVGGRGEPHHEALLEVLNKQYPDRCVAPGWLPHAELQEWIERASLLVMPSRYEPFGMVALEALRAGVPVLGADIEGLRELLAEGSGGATVRGHDPVDWAKAIANLLDDPCRMQQMRALGPRYVQAQYSLEAYGQRYVSVLRRCMAELAMRPSTRTAAFPHNERAA